jgi:hypothetical protein
MMIMRFGETPPVTNHSSVVIILLLMPCGLVPISLFPLANEDDVDNVTKERRGKNG